MKKSELPQKPKIKRRLVCACNLVMGTDGFPTREFNDACPIHGAGKPQPKESETK